MALTGAARKRRCNKYLGILGGAVTRLQIAVPKPAGAVKVYPFVYFVTACVRVAQTPTLQEDPERRDLLASTSLRG
jgi:hypothetical protein